MEWTHDPEFWETLDDLMMNTWPLLDDWLAIAHNHKGEFNVQMRTILFGGLGQFVASYNEARNEANDPPQALAIAMEATVRNPMFSVMMSGAVENAIDEGVEGMTSNAEEGGF